jgi:hypothetical protein
VGYLAIWIDGKWCRDAQLVCIELGVSIADCPEPDEVSPIGLDEVEAALNFVKDHFPSGWIVKDKYPVAFNPKVVK